MKKTILILIVAFAGFSVASCMFGPKAPLEDGLYLSYQSADSSIRVTFEEISGNKYRATTTPGGGEKIVDKSLRTELGGIYEVGLLGPLWIPPGEVEVGGNAHGDEVTEVKRWNGWEVGVVKASFGRGALQGEWYYEKKTGFLVGGSKTTAFSDEGEGMHFVLVESNLDIL